MPARTRCSPPVSLCPSFNEARPRSSWTLARSDQARHQSSQRSSEPVTSSKSASSTPFETKRGAQCEIADATRESLAKKPPWASPPSINDDADDDERGQRRGDPLITVAARHDENVWLRPLKGRLIRGAREEDLIR